MTALASFAAWLATTPLTALVTARAWIVPAIQVVHIVAIAVVVIAVALVNLRALGLVEVDRPAPAVLAAWFPVILGAVGVLAVTGALLIASEPGRALFRTVFWGKLGLIVVALLLTGAHRWFPGESGAGARVGRIAPRVLAIASLLAWVGVIYAGRWIAYADGWPGAVS